jgi:hypothetical protein
MKIDHFAEYWKALREGHPDVFRLNRLRCYFGLPMD